MTAASTARSPGSVAKALALLSRRERAGLAGVLVVLLFVAIVEVIGIASILPFIAAVTNPQALETNATVARVTTLLGLESREEILVALGIAVLTLLVLGNLAKAVALWLTLRYENTLNSRIAQRLLNHYLARPYTFYLVRNASELAKNVLAEVRTVVGGVIGPSLQIAASGLVAAAVIVLLLVVNPLVAVSIALVLATAYSLVYALTRRMLARIGQEQVLANAEKFRAANEAMAGIKDIKVLGRESYFLDRFARFATQHARNNVAAGVVSAVPRFALESLAFGGIVALLVGFIASGRPTDEIIPLVALYAFAGYRLLPAFQSVYSSVSTLQYHRAALDTLHRDFSLDDGRPLEGARGALPRIELERSLVMRRASFSYPGSRRRALGDVTIEIPANTTVAFVGPTGSGKTTAVDVLLGLLVPTDGDLLVDGRRIGPENVRGWQRSVGYVPQQIYLVDDSVRNNIAFGVPAHEIDDAEVERAARLADIHDFVVGELPQGYDTLVGDRGVRLSGGQRQRIGIARALYRDPSVLIFDEATSALDRLTEEAIIAAIRALAGRKTIVLIAHRLTTVRHCDRIFVIDKGALVASGTYPELRESSRWFRMATGA